MSSLFVSVFLIKPVFSASSSFCAIQVSEVGVWESFWNPRVIAWVDGLCMFSAFVTAFIMSWSCDGSFR